MQIGAKVWLFLADGFEEIEAVSIIDVLRRAEINTVTIAVTPSGNQVTSARHLVVQADLHISECKSGDLEQITMMIFPGGKVGVDNMRNHAQLKNLLSNFADRMKTDMTKYVAAICAAPDFLAEQGLLLNIQATGYPSFFESLENHKVSVKDMLVVEDQNRITSQGPATAIPFAIHLVKILKGKAVAEKLRGDLLLKKISELKQIESLQSIILGYEQVLKLNEEEIGDLEKLNAMYNSLVEFNRAELIDAHESIKASENVRDLSRTELISALNKIKQLEQKIISLTGK